MDELKNVMLGLGKGKEEENIIANSETKAIMTAPSQVQVRALVDSCIYKLYDNNQNVQKCKPIFRLIMDEMEKLGFEGAEVITQTLYLIKTRYKKEFKKDLDIEAKHLLT